MNRSNLKLTALLVTILLPITTATVVFMLKDGSGQGGTTNKGELIIPVIDVTEFQMRTVDGDVVFLDFDASVEGVDPSDYVPRPWSLIYLGGNVCDASCEERLSYLRQLHRRLGAESSRVTRFYLNTEAELAQQSLTLFSESFPEMNVTYTNGVALQERLSELHGDAFNVSSDHYIYVVDPVGNVMLYFTPENPPEEILSDLDTLLDKSSLG